MGRRLAHIRHIGEGPPGWGNTQKWGLLGASPSVSVYDQPSAVEDSGLHRSYRGGVNSTHNRAPAGEYTTTRQARVSALQNSLPAAAFFGSYAGAGTGRSWSPNAVAYTPHTALHQSFNPHMAGAAELHPATVYDPFPSPSSLYPKAV